MNWDLFYRLFVCILMFWTLIVLLGEKIPKPRKDQLLQILKRATPPDYRTTVASLHSFSLEMFERFFLQRSNESSSTLSRRLNSVLWLFILIATVLALFCAVGYGWMRLPGQLESILAMILVGALAAAVTISCYVARTNAACSGHPSLPRRLWRTLFWIALAIALVTLPFLLFDWNYTHGLREAPHEPESFRAFARSQPVFTLRLSVAPSITFSLTLLALGILVGLICAVFTGLSVGGIEGAWSGVAVGLWTGFTSALVGYCACVEWHMIKAASVMQIIIIVGLGIAFTPFIAKSVRLFRHELSTWQSDRFRRLCAYSAHVTLLTSMLWMALLAFATFIVARHVYSQFQSAVLSTSIVYLALNAIADSFSIIETHWVLNKLKKSRTLLRVVCLVVIDLFLSSLIYLVLPVATRSYDIIPAILFGGPKPWLGILFWSTILTSVIFYVFLVVAVAALFLVPWRALIRFSTLLDDPVRAIAFMGLILSTVIAMVLSLVF